MAQARPPAEAPPASAEAKPAPRKGEPQWFRVRIVEKAGKRAQRLDQPPARHRPRARRRVADRPPRGVPEGRHCPTLGEVLRALDSGQSLVEIEDDETTVRVWVE